ncbi:MAG: helix-turn-helix domain-containing protein [Phycisphaerales bacterium]|nr:helix-turn-helix domain-containing protein [Phycisphaerales bacterium]
MAKMFYSAKEAAEKLGKSETDLKDLVRSGKLREFRDAGSINYKVGDVDMLAKSGGAAPASGKPPAAKSPASGKSAVGKSAVGKSGVGKFPAGSKAGSSALGSASQSGEILLEPADDSGVELAPSGSDIMSLEEVDAEDTAVGARAEKKKKEGSSIPSVGMNVFDDDELDEHVDPLAQTAVSDVAGLGLEGVGSGSGILDLTRESDDTSLGADLLEEISTGDEQPEGTGGTIEMGEDTRAGLDAAVGVEEHAEPPPTADAFEPAAAATTVTPSVRQRTMVTRVVEYGPDAVSTSLTAAMVVAVAVIWIAGVAAAAALQGVSPSLVSSIYSNMLIVAPGAFVVAGLAAGITYFLSKRSS